MDSTKSAACSRKVHKCSDGGGVAIPVDRFSNLPESLICYILSFMPTKYAVATSVLSKRWRFLWTQVSALDFNFDEERKEKGYGKDRMNLKQFINKVLIHHKAETVDKFFLKLHDPHVVYVNIWVSYAIARNVKSLHLCVSDEYYPENEDEYIDLPDSLFTCGTLESLSLNGRFLVTVDSVYLPKLEYLLLGNVLYESDESFRFLISGCPVLHRFSIRGHPDENNVRVYDISSPLLRSLTVSVSNELIEEVKLDVPALEYISLSGEFYPPEISLQGLTSLNEASLRIKHSVDKLLLAVSGVKSLTLSNDFFSQHMVATRFERLTKLSIVTDWRSMDWSFLDFLHCSMKLQVLCILKPYRCKETCWRSPVQVPECLLYSLAEVSFSGFEGLKCEIEFIKYILQHGAVMKLINLASNASCDTKEKLDIAQKILVLPRISPCCQIKFC